MLDYKDKEYGFDTLMIHAGTEPDPVTHAVNLPVYQATAYTFDSTEHARRLFELAEPGNIYTRLSNPTVDALERRVAALDGGIGALAMSSGHAVMVAAFLNLASQGDEIVSSICIYGGAINMMGVTLGRMGINVKFVDPDDLSAWENAVTDKTKAFFVEAVGNPNVNLSDIEAIAAIAHKHGIPMIVDSTFTTPYLIQPIRYGADYVIHSATKFLGGHGTAMCGIVTDAGTFQFKGNPRFPLYNEPDVSYHGVVFADMGEGAFITRLRALVLRDMGACCAPMNAFLILQGIETLSLRMRRHSESALAVAKYLSENPDVSFVHYPGLPGDTYYQRAEKYLPRGAGGVMTFGVKGGRAACAKFIDSLKLITHVANVGDVRTLVIHPATTTHSQLSDEQLAQAGITAETIRLSVGLEDVTDIIADIEQAIACTKQ